MNNRNGEPERVATIGGTFNAMHDGHKDYIKLSFDFAERIFIYVTSDRFVNGNGKLYPVQTYQERVKQIENYLTEINKLDKCEIHPIDRVEDILFDYLDNPETNTRFYMAIVTPEYYDFFIKINHIRQKKGIRPFLLLVKMRTRNDKNFDISSCAIYHNLYEYSDLELLSEGLGDLSPKPVIQSLSFGGSNNGFK